jgi:hypothetical protein
MKWLGSVPERLENWLKRRKEKREKEEKPKILFPNIVIASAVFVFLSWGEGSGSWFNPGSSWNPYYNKNLVLTANLHYYCQTTGRYNEDICKKWKAERASDEQDRHEKAALLVDLTFNKPAYRKNVLKGAREAMQSRWKSDPVAMPYADVMTSAVMEVLEKYVDDTNSQNNAKKELAMAENGIPSYYLGEMIKSFQAGSGYPLLLKLIIQEQRLEEKDIGRQLICKPPLIIQKKWELKSQLALPQKYQQMVKEKIEALQEQGKLPKEWK